MSLLFILNTFLHIAFQTYKRVTNYVREYYFGQQEINNETIYNYIDLLSDIFYTYGIQKTVQKYSKFKSAKTYYYK